MIGCSEEDECIITEEDVSTGDAAEDRRKRLPGVGKVKMTVGVRRSDKMIIQYCITTITTGKTKQEASVTSC